MGQSLSRLYHQPNCYQAGSKDHPPTLEHHGWPLISHDDGSPAVEGVWVENFHSWTDRSHHQLLPHQHSQPHLHKNAHLVLQEVVIRFETQGETQEHLEELRKEGEKQFFSLTNGFVRDDTHH